MSSASWKAYALPGAAFFVLVVILVATWTLVRSHEVDLLEVETGVTAEQIARRLEVYLGTRFELVDHLRAQWLRGAIDDADAFRSAALGIQEQFGGFMAINWIDPGGVIRWVVPEERNLPALGRDMHRHPDPHAVATFLAAEASLQPRATPPVALLQGGLGLASYFPIVRDGRLVGYVNGVFGIEPMIEDCLSEGFGDAFGMRIRDGEDLVHERGFEERAGGGEAIVQSGDLGILDRTWTVDLVPTRAAVRPGTFADTMGLAIGIAMAGLLALAIGMLGARARALRESERRYRSLVETAAGVVLVVDPEGRVLEFNREAERVYGVTRAEVLGEDYFERFVPAEVRETARAELERILAEGEARGYENPIVTRSGETRLMHWNATRVLDSTGRATGVLAVGQDLTERQKVESERARLEIRIREAQKLESLGILAGGIAHDFNNLLTGILGNVGLAMMKTRPESPIRGVLARIEAAAQRSAELTNQLLAYSGKGRFVVQPIRLSDLVEEMAHLLETVVSKRATVQYQFAGDLPAIEADATQVRQVVMNLLTNASDAVEAAGGVIRIRSGVEEIEAERPGQPGCPDGLAPGCYVFLEVSDTGVGMDRETLSRIFDPFFTTKKKGRGLGLAAVLGIMRSHGGAIRVYSEPDRGTSFKILFPASDREAAATLAHGPEARGWRGEGAVLVIDDAETVVEVARETLEGQGFEVLTATGGREGIRIFAERAADVRLVLLDLTMPDLSGGEVFRELRRIDPDVPVLLSSGYSEEEVAAPFAGRAIAGFLQKPYTPSSLLDRVERVLLGPREGT